MIRIITFLLPLLISLMITKIEFVSMSTALVDEDQAEKIAGHFKDFILELTEDCQELHDHLANSTTSLDWTAKQLSSGLLKLAVSLENAFGHEILGLFLRE